MFTNLPWRIDDVSVLDIQTDFIKEENVIKSDLWNGHQHRKRASEGLPNPKPVKNIKTTQDKIKEATFIKLRKFALPYYPQRSVLNLNQHRNILEALKILQSNKNPALYTETEKKYINLYRFIKSKIQIENVQFLQFVEKKWKEQKYIRRISLHNKLEHHSICRWHNEIERVKKYHQYYAMHTMISLLDRKSLVEAVNLENLIEMGHLAKIDLPILDDKTHFNLFQLQHSEVFLPPYLEESKKIVSKDKNAEMLAKKYLPDIVISSSGLKTIMDNYGPNYNHCWDIPVVVRTYNENGISKNISFIDKPFPKRNPTIVDFNNKCRKQSLKTSFCQKLGFSFDTDKWTKELGYTFINNKNKKKFNENFISTKNDNSKSEDIVLNISENKNLELINSKTNDESYNKDSNNKFELLQNEEKGKQNDSKPAINDMLFENQDINKTGKSNVGKKGKKKKNKGKINEAQQKTNKKSCNIKNYRNAIYRMWVLKVHDQNSKDGDTRKEIKIMTRCKLDGCKEISKNNFKPFMLLPKVEYQWEYGSELVTKSDLLRQWVTLFFRPSTDLIRVLVPSKNNSIMFYDHCSIHKINNELLQNYNFIPSKQLAILHNVLANLVNINDGNYILHHEPNQGSFAALMKSIEKPVDTNGVFDLHNYYNEENCNVEKDMNWVPINQTFILPFHESNGIVPAMFPSIYENDKGKKTKQPI